MPKSTYNKHTMAQTLDFTCFSHEYFNDFYPVCFTFLINKIRFQVFWIIVLFFFFHFLAQVLCLICILCSIFFFLVCHFLFVVFSPFSLFSLVMGLVGGAIKLSTIVFGHVLLFVLFLVLLFFSLFLPLPFVCLHSSPHQTSQILWVKDVGLIGHESGRVVTISCTSCK